MRMYKRFNFSSLGCRKWQLSPLHDFQNQAITFPQLFTIILPIYLLLILGANTSTTLICRISGALSRLLQVFRVGQIW